MKLKQKIRLGFHVFRLKALAMASPKHAAKLAFQLFCTPYSGKPKRVMPAIFHKAEKRQLLINELLVKGFYWKATKGGEKTILICHGFDSCSYKFEKYVHNFLNSGMNVMAFDAPAHGISEGKKINAMLYSSTIVEIIKKFGPVYGIMGHSLGGMAALFAMEKMKSPHIKVALIAPATETSTAAKFFLNLIKFKNGLLYDELISVIEEKGGKDISWFSSGRAVQTIENKVLWIHDKDDKVCPFADTLPIQNANLKNIVFVATEELGHNKIYHEAYVQKKISTFFMD